MTDRRLMSNWGSKPLRVEPPGRKTMKMHLVAVVGLAIGFAVSTLAQEQNAVTQKCVAD